MNILIKYLEDLAFIDLNLLSLIIISIKKTSFFKINQINNNYLCLVVITNEHGFLISAKYYFIYLV